MFLDSLESDGSGHFRACESESRCDFFSSVLPPVCSGLMFSLFYGFSGALQPYEVCNGVDKIQGVQGPRFCDGIRRQ